MARAVPDIEGGPVDMNAIRCVTAWRNCSLCRAPTLILANERATHAYALVKRVMRDIFASQRD